MQKLVQLLAFILFIYLFYHVGGGLLLLHSPNSSPYKLHLYSTTISITQCTIYDYFLDQLLAVNFIQECKL